MSDPVGHRCNSSRAPWHSPEDAAQLPENVAVESEEDQDRDTNQSSAFGEVSDTNSYFHSPLGTLYSASR